MNRRTSIKTLAVLTIAAIAPPGFKALADLTKDTPCTIVAGRDDVRDYLRLANPKHVLIVGEEPEALALYHTTRDSLGKLILYTNEPGIRSDELAGGATPATAEDLASDRVVAEIRPGFHYTEALRPDVMLTKFGGRIWALDLHRREFTYWPA